MTSLLRPTACLVAGLALLSPAGCKGGAPKAGAASPSAAPVLTVAVQAAAPREIASALTLNGAIAAWQPLAVSPAATGLLVVEVLAAEGRHVSKGQVLARLDDRAVRAQLADAQARLASAEAALQKARFPGRAEDVSTASAALAEAEARLTNAQADHDRAAMLRAEGAVTAAEFDAKAVALAAARSARQQARDRVSVLRDGGRREDVAVAAAAAAQARAAVTQASVQLANTRVTAPAAGLVLKQDVLIGDVATVGKPMFTLARDNRLEMAANAAERDLPRLKPGQPVTVAAVALPGLTAKGTIREVSPSLSTSNRMATVRIDLPVGTAFKPGMSARGQVAIGRAQALAVPTDAVVSRDGKQLVFVVHDGVADAREIVAGDAAGAWTPVSAGLQAGERVVVEGAGFLQPGDAVTVAPATEGAK